MLDRGANSPTDINAFANEIQFTDMRYETYGLMRLHRYGKTLFSSSSAIALKPVLKSSDRLNVPASHASCKINDRLSRIFIDESYRKITYF